MGDAVSIEIVGGFFIADVLNIDDDDDDASEGNLRNSPPSKLRCSAAITETSLLTSASNVGVVSSSAMPTRLRRSSCANAVQKS